MIDVTVIILTKNESVNLPDCLASIKDFAARTVVVDSGSDDDTVKIARAAGADVFVHSFENYAKQFNWALANTGITTRWCFRLDADERLTPALCDELSEIVAAHEGDDVNGVVMEARLYFLGRCIRHGCRNKRKLMLFKTGLAVIEDRKMDEHTVLLSGRAVAARERFLHYDFKDMTHWINKMNWYATREMQDYFDFKNGKGATGARSGDGAISTTRRRKFGLYYRFPMFVRSLLVFWYFYIFKLGFLDGRAGYIYNYMYHRWYRNLVDTKIYEQLLTNRPFEETGDLKG